MNEPVTIAICNHKGGVAKTETVYRLGIQFAERHLKPLLVDCDPQANLTRRLRTPGHGRQNTSALLGGAVQAQIGLHGAARIICAPDWNHPLGYAIGADISLENVAVGLMQRNFGRLTALQNAIQRERHFFSGPILIDTPPNAGILTLNALVAATYVLICSDPEPDAIAGVRRICEIVGDIERERGQAPQILGVLATRADAQLTRHNEGMKELSAADMPPILGIIPKRAGQDANARLNEAYKPVAERVLAEVGHG